MTTLLSKAEEATAEEPVSESRMADLEKQVSEQGTVVSQVKEVRPHPPPFVCLLHDQYSPSGAMPLGTQSRVRGV